MKFQIKTVLLAIFVGVGALVAGQGWFALGDLSTIHDFVDGIYSDQLPSVLDAQAMQSAFDRIRIDQAAYVLADKSEGKAAAAADIGEAGKIWQAKFDEYKGLIDPEHVTELENFTKIGDLYKQLGGLQTQLFTLADAGKRDEVVALYAGAMADIYQKD